jgi:hypothetical protein
LSGERGPIFLQFIDCVHQLLVQYPMAFEFNDKFLLAILYHLYSCRYGTFLLNSEKERVEYNIKNSTLSVWALLDSDQVRSLLSLSAVLQFLSFVFTCLYGPIDASRFLNSSTQSMIPALP